MPQPDPEARHTFIICNSCTPHTSVFNKARDVMLTVVVRSGAADAHTIIKQVAKMRTAAQAEMVLDQGSESEVVITYLLELLQQAQAQQSEQERIVQHQTFLNIPKMVNNDLALAKEEVNLPLTFILCCSVPLTFDCNSSSVIQMLLRGRCA